VAEFVPAMAAASEASSYRIKFRRAEFLELVDAAKPRFIYRRGKNHFFAFDGFLMYCQQCRDSDFSQRVIDSIELTNYQWQT